MTGTMRTWLATALVAVTCAALPAAAQPPGAGGAPGMPPEGRGGQPPPGMRPGGPGWQMFLMRLELSEQQRTAIKQLMDEARDADQAAVEQVRAVQLQLAAAIYTTTPDSSAIGALLVQLTEAQRPLIEADVALQQKVSAVLTENQRARLLESMKQVPPRGGPPARR